MHRPAGLPAHPSTPSLQYLYRRMLRRNSISSRQLCILSAQLLIGLNMWKVIILLMLTMKVSAALAVDVVKIFQAEADDARHAFALQLLDEILKSTETSYGPYVKEPYTGPLSPARSRQLTAEGRLINVIIRAPGRPEDDYGLIPVMLPIDKGLLGYRVALIAPENQEKISRIRNREQLRALHIGQVRGWSDVEIYEHNNIPVTLAPNYTSLILMLERGRFDLFPRGAIEVLPELQALGSSHPRLAVEDHLLIRYPFAEFYYVSNSAPRLASRLTQGFEQSVKAGRFDAMFNQHYKKMFDELKLTKRVLIELDNPFLPAWVPLNRKEFWFDPIFADPSAP